MNKKLWIVVIILAVVLFSLVLWRGGIRPSVATEPHLQPPATDRTTMQKNVEIQNKSRAETLDDFTTSHLQKFQQRSGNITLFLNQFYERCDVTDCDVVLMQALDNYADQRFAQQLKNLIQRLPRYETDMQNTVLSTSLSPRERFDHIWQLREKNLGIAETKLGFAQEREYANYRFSYAEIKDNPQLSVTQKLNAFDDLQHQFPNLADSTQGFARYEQALTLMDKNMSVAEQQQFKTMLQMRYLSKEEQVDVQFQEQRQNKQAIQAQNYQRAVQQLEQEMQPLKGQLSDTQWQQQYEQRLQDLRLKMFP